MVAKEIAMHEVADRLQMGVGFWRSEGDHQVFVAFH
jgi:hypothetical protein